MATSSKTILITGGASGIGLGMTHHFASLSTPTARNDIFILDVNTNAFPSLTTSLTTTYPSATFTFLHCDVSSWPSISSCFQTAYTTTSHIDIVMANAGISAEGALIDPDPFADPLQPTTPSINVNLIGAIYTVKLAAHYMRRNPLPSSPPTTAASSQPNGTMTQLPSRGKIIVTSSNASLYAFPIAPIYAAAKAAVSHLVRSLALPLSLPDSHIQVNALAPAVLQTNIAPNPALFKNMILTPMQTLCRGVDYLLADESDGKVRTGLVAEVHGEKVSVREGYDWIDEDSKANLEEFWRLGYA